MTRDHSEAQEHRHAHPHEHGEHGHTHGAVDPTIATSERGIWAIKWSFVALMATALLQLVVVLLSGSVALLSDTIHNVGDAATAVPLGIAFALTRLGASRRFTFGYGRVEDLAGVMVVLIILFSAGVAAYQAVERLIHPQQVGMLWAVAVAALIGFAGNEAVAVFRIRVGRQIGSAALVADGYHARTDGWTSLAVLAGAIGVWLGYPIADPIIGLLIAAAIFVIVWQSARSITPPLPTPHGPGPIPPGGSSSVRGTKSRPGSYSRRWFAPRWRSFLRQLAANYGPASGCI